MSNNGTVHHTTEEPAGSKRRSLAVLRTVALVVTAIGALGSVALTLLEGRSTPRLLLVGFVLWVLSPFAGLAWANLLSTRWAVPTRIMLAGVSHLVALASLAIYSKLIPPPAGSPAAFVFVATPPASWLLAAIFIGATALVARKRRR